MRELQQDIWVAEKGFSLFAAELGNRMTVVRLADGRLWLHSPVEFNAELKEEVDALGEVAYIVTPNRFHGLFVEEWRQAYPHATYYTVPHVRVEPQPGAYILSEDKLPWSASLHSLPLAGMDKVGEWVFFHLASNTLILTDLCFNMPRRSAGWTGLFSRINGTHSGFGPSRLMKRVIDEPYRLGQSLREILQWPVQRIILSHGEIVESNGAAQLRHAFADYLKEMSPPARASAS